MLEREDAMIVDQLILHSTGFIGDPLPEGRFDLAGSGFYVYVEEDDYAFQYFITAHHVVDAYWRDRNAPFPPEGDIHLRISRKDGHAPFHLRTKKSDWIFPEDRRVVDLCAYLI
jgi:hypothetical protein